MIFTSRNTYAELIQGPKGGTEEALLKMVHDTWGKFNQFLDNNLKMLLIFIKDITQLRDRQKEQVMSLIQTHKGMSSHSASDEGSPDSPTMVKSNGMIYHDFNYPEYVNQRFAEEEVMKKDFYLIACEPEAEKETKIPEYSITDKNLTPYQIEMRKMKTVIKKAEIHASENVNGAAEFRAQFTDFLKNVNQSYAILKGSTAEDKTKKDDKADKTTVAEDIGQSSLNLFQKTKTKKKFTISEMKPRAKVEPRVASAVLNDNSKVGGSSRRLSAVKNPRRLNDSSIKYDDSDSGIKDRIMTNFGRSVSQGRRRSREMFDSLNRTRESSLKVRARRQRVAESDFDPSDYDFRKPKDFSSILFSEKFNASSVLRSRLY